MNILVLGSGAREHAICWAIKKSPKCKNIFCIPGNSGISKVAKCFDFNPQEKNTIYKFCKKNKIDLVVVGPENLLEIGISDYLKKKFIPVFGPEKKASRLETSKLYAKKFLKRNNIPTGDYSEFSKIKESVKYISDRKPPYVIKVDGLASGKGVMICEDIDSAKKVLEDIFLKKKFGEAGKKIVIEEFLEGFEMSFFTFLDGSGSLDLGYALDHKKLFNDDRGPNTGGMGAFAPSKIVSKELLKKIKHQIILPTINSIKKEKIVYRGIIFFGLIITKNGPKVIEYNARFGDPECQTLLQRLDSDLLEILNATANDKVKNCRIKLSQDYSICVVLSSKGYPGKFGINKLIPNLEKVKDTKNINIFHAATTKKNEKYFSNGGRVLSITSRHKNYKKARENAYNYLKKINWKYGHYRDDIGEKNIK